ncbi:MAG: hypothetical protein Q4C47_05720, partial [Planctomycetia bacterium]|nr:hypothetical protein [Planctomycetia bacterium]
SIPFHENESLYPTVELSDRLYTPESLRHRFPLRIELTQSDLEYALVGKLVTRVIYLEDPETAFPVADAARGEGLGSFDVAPEDDPLAIADLFGRPLAIVRIGGRRPAAPGTPDSGFTFGATPYVRYPSDTTDEFPGTGSETIGNDLTISDPYLSRGEYLLNGGDRGLKERGLSAALTEADEIPAGLDSGDAVATFESMDGAPELVVINRVPLYAPRFGSIRKITGLTEQSSSLGWRDVEQKASPVSVGTREVAATRKQHEAPRGAQSGQKASAALGTEGLNRAETTIALAMHRDEYGTWENFQRIRTGEADAAESLSLSASSHAARSWEQPEELKIFFGDDVVSSVARIDSTSEVYFVDRADKQYGKLQVTKVASAADAAPGETVEFTIRYDNIGEAPIAKVRIVDSLSPRLEYVDGSAESELASQFRVAPNERGSVILEWELDQPLLPGEGGIVRFTTQVR